MAHDSNVFAEALPDVRKMLAQKSCADHPCSQKVIDQALFDIYATTLERKGDAPMGVADIS
jgi:hypothetical protein